MMLPPTSLPGEGQSAVYKRLWVHEVFRVFCDRLVDDAERVWLLQQVCTPSALLQASSHMDTSAPPGSHPGPGHSSVSDQCCLCTVKGSGDCATPWD